MSIKRMRILLTGAGGMLGTSLTPILEKQKHTLFISDLNPEPKNGIKFLDVRDLDAVQEAADEFEPDIIMHLAAETDVDICEQNTEHAFMTNSIGTQNVALVCQRLDIPMMYISSVGIFDGDKNLPYNESDVPRPVNVYGFSKLEGEVHVKNMLNRFFIVRAGWMFGGGPGRGKKFVEKIIEQIKNGKKELTVVNDKIGTPTYTYEIAAHLAKLIQTEYWGTYHCACKGTCSRVEVAQEIVDVMGMKKKVTIKEVSSANYPLPAHRPYSECMDNMNLRLRGLDTMPHWKPCVRKYVKKLYM